MRAFSTLDESVIPFLAELLPKLTQKLTIVAKNPSRPHFNHYLFETISLSIRLVYKVYNVLYFNIYATMNNLDKVSFYC